MAACLFFAPLSLLAQEPAVAGAAESTTSAIEEISAAEVVEIVTTEPPTAAERGEVGSLEEMVNPPVSVPETKIPVPVPDWVPPVIQAYIPDEDTKPGIGIMYPAGSTDFVYLAAGIRPPGGDPRLPPLPGTPLLIPVEVGPWVTYEPAPKGSKAVMIRDDERQVIHNYPPGSALRGGTGRLGHAGVTRPGLAVFPGGIPDVLPVTTETGEELIQNFPPGSRVVGNVPNPQ
jgi:hypothetical protein